MTAVDAAVLTFVFTDIEGSTKLLRRAGQGIYGQLLADHHHILREAIEHRHGEIMGTEGDGVFAIFRTPTDAIAATLAAQRALAGFAWGEYDVRVRMGIHTGEATRQDTEWIGVAIHEAARVANAAIGGQVLVSETARTLAGSDLPPDSYLRDLGRFQLKDVPEPCRIFQLVHVDLDAEPWPIRATQAAQTNLPDGSDRFIGRRRELDEVSRLLEDHRLVTITGPGGGGKTRLAMEVCKARAGGRVDSTWLIELAPVAPDAQVQDEVARAVGLRPEPGEQVIDALRDRFGAEQVLLLFDNCEHVIDAAANAVGPLLAGCPGVTVLATSREPLSLAGEVTWSIPALSMSAQPDHPSDTGGSDAVELFLAVANRAVPDLVLDGDEPAAVAEICQRLDGLPLAIELVAPWVRSLSPTQIVERLETNVFGLTSKGSRTAAPRHRTLRDTIKWSHELLTDQEQTVLHRLSVFVAGCTVDAAEAVCSGGSVDAADVLEVLDGLIDRSMVRSVAGPDGDRRLQMLETIRQFAFEQLVEAGEDEHLRSKHARWFATMADGSARPLLESDLAHIDHVEAEEPNLEAALEWSRSADPTLAEQIAAGIWRYWDLRGSEAAGIAHLRQVVDRAPDVDSSRRAAVLYGLAYLLTQVNGPPDEAFALLDRSIAMARRVDDRHLLAESLGHLAFMRWQVEPDADVDALVDEAEGLARSSGDEYLIAQAIWTRGFGARQRGELDVSDDLFRSSKDFAHRIANDDMLESAAVAMGWNALDAGRHREAAEHLSEVLAIAIRRSDNFVDYSFGLLCLAEYLDGDMVATRRTVERALAGARSHSQVARRVTLIVAAGVTASEGRPDDAALLLGSLHLDTMALGRGRFAATAFQLVRDEVRRAIGDDGFDRALTRGASLRLDEALTQAGFSV